MNAAETTRERLDRERAEANERVPFAWRIVKVDLTKYYDEHWAAEHKLKSAAIYYVYDANRHVHICSFTPSQELWPVAAEVIFATEEAQEADEGETEMECLQSEDACTYMDVSVVERMPSRPISWAPDREPGEDAEAYYERACEEFREHYQGNTPYFNGKGKKGETA